MHDAKLIISEATIQMLGGWLGSGKGTHLWLVGHWLAADCVGTRFS
jgi:type IV secretory pathway TrbD component